MTAPLWIGPCASCGLTGSSTLTRSCPRCGARKRRDDAAFEHLRGNHVAGAQLLWEAEQLEAEARR